MLGRVKNFNFDKGYGFVRPEHGGNGKDDHFIHITALNRAGIEVLNQDDLVEYDIEPDQRSGKMRACDIRIVERASLSRETI